MGLCALAGLPLALERIKSTLSTVTSPLSYIAITLALGVFLAFCQARKGALAESCNTLWLGYLLYIGVVEELAFRLLFPMWLGEIVNPMGAIVAGNLIFAGLPLRPTMALVELRLCLRGGYGF